jgi:DNA-binding NtrC family response regulator/CHASE2 domain-containing sensor protein
VIHAALIGLLATILAWAGWFVGGTSLTALEWTVYDTWMRLRQPIPVSPYIVVIKRDPASDARFGGGAWDHAVLARLITALGRSGSAVIGLEAPLGEPSPPARGGIASDAMLIEATKSAGKVVYPLRVNLSDDTASQQALPDMAHSSWPIVKPDQARSLRQADMLTGLLPALAEQAKAVGHTLILPDGDGVVRSTPLYVTLNDRAIPAFGLAMAAVFLQVTPEQMSIHPGDAVTFREARLPDGRTAPVTIPIDDRGQTLINYAGDFTSLSFLDVWKAIEERETERLREWVGGKIVLLLPAGDGPNIRTPLERPAPSAVVQAHLLNALLTGKWLTQAPPVSRALGALLLAGLAAWLILSVGGWKGFASVAALAASYLIMVPLALSLGGWILPVLIPVGALTLATAGATVWMHLTASYRMRLMEGNMLRIQQELVAVREALVCQESNTEGLEEDLEAARASAARSTGKEQELVRAADILREQLSAAQAQESATRGRLRELERELQGLRAVTSETGPLGDAEQERLRIESEQMGIVTRSPQVLAVFRDIKKGARSPLSVLITGEPGTGKELFARAVHLLSPRASHAFIAVNMAAISPELFESELFGHVRGSFTGATGDRKGYFELAHQGTIFMDEIGDLRLDHQGKLLRVLQEKTFYRVGATKPTTIDVRVVAATNKDLQRGVSEGWFREDLYFRLNGMALRLPPLRERPHDVPPLAERFVLDAAARVGRSSLRLSEEALAALQAQPWKGNIRELQHCLERAVALAEGAIITRKDLRVEPREAAGAPSGQSGWSCPPDPNSDEAVLACLRRHEFDMQATARALGWDRSTVTQRLKGMGFRALVEAGGDQPKAALILAGDPALVRTVELKLLEYYEHLLKTLHGFASPEEAVAACRKRFKNLPDRHYRFVEVLIRKHFSRA